MRGYFWHGPPKKGNMYNVVVVVVMVAAAMGTKLDEKLAKTVKRVGVERRADVLFLNFRTETRGL